MIRITQLLTIKTCHFEKGKKKMKVYVCDMCGFQHKKSANESETPENLFDAMFVDADLCNTCSTKIKTILAKRRNKIMKYIEENDDLVRSERLHGF